MGRFYCHRCDLTFIREDRDPGATDYCPQCGPEDTPPSDEDLREEEYRAIAQRLQYQLKEGNSHSLSAQTLETLLENPGVANVCVHTGMLLHLAAHKGDAVMVDALLAYGADPNARSKSGGTALHWLAKSCEAKCGAQIVAALVGSGTLVDARDEEGKTALILAANQCSWWEEDQEVAKDDIMRPAASEREVVEALLKHGADVNATDESGRSALHYVAMASSVVLIELLLERGANANLKDGKARTVLDAWGAGRGNGLAKVLLQSAMGNVAERKKPVIDDDDSEVDSEDEHVRPASTLGMYFPRPRG